MAATRRAWGSGMGTRGGKADIWGGGRWEREEVHLTVPSSPASVYNLG